MPTCVRNGCKKNYDPAAAKENECNYHEGGPIFHEGLKGWSCCSKRVTDFDQFLKIPGCCSGYHTELEAPKPINPLNEDTPSAQSRPSSIPPTTCTEKKSETFSDLPSFSNLNVKCNAPANASSVPNQTLKPVEPEFPDRDPLNAVIPLGTQCRRRGCSIQYKEGELPECKYHPGFPVFHEGSKGWSCCTRKVLEFDVFMNLQGCQTTPYHTFISTEPVTLPPVRTDWYQTRDSVIVSVFVKGCKKESSSVLFSSNGVEWNLDSPSGTQLGSLTTYMPIDPDSSTFKFLSTKIELSLKKTSGISWPLLEKSDAIPPVETWTTFGTTSGRGGTVGGKAMDVATDAPIYAAP